MSGILKRSTAHLNFMDVVRRLMFRWLICKSCSRRQAFCIISQAVHNATSATLQAWKSPTSHTTDSSNTNMRQKWLYGISRALHVFCIHQEGNPSMQFCLKLKSSDRRTVWVIPTTPPPTNIADNLCRHYPKSLLPYIGVN